MTTARGLAAAHPAVAAYAARHRLDAAAFRADGRLTLRFDGRYRVQVRPAADGRIALTARLLELAGRTPAAIDDLLVQLATLGCGLLREQAAGLAIDEADHALILQQQLSPDTGADALEADLADFVNALSFWSRTCASHAARA